MSNHAFSPLADTPPLALRLPLYGSRLIEASAGTGKTWTIAALYLRLVLGHGAAPALGADLLASASSREPLVPSQILVMTFTRAATQELNARIRERLSEAARFFRGESDDSEADALLHSLRSDYAPGPLRELAAWRLANAADTMDEAAIYTIDAWCNKVLQSYASLTGALQGDELGGDTQTLWQWAALDFWRNQVYPLPLAQLQQVLQLWPDAQRWLDHSHEWQNSQAPALPGDAQTSDAHAGPASAADEANEHLDLQAWLHVQLAQQQAALASLTQDLVPQLAAFEQWLDGQTDKDGDTGKYWSGVKLKPQSYRQWLAAIARWAQQPGATIDGVQDKQLWRLTPEGLLDARTSKAPPLDCAQLPAASARLEQLQQALAALPSIKQGIVSMAVRYTQQRWQQLKSQHGAMDFADLLLRVQQALASEQGATLRQRLLCEYPVAMIDEFQDTSPGQYHVFHDLYRPQDNDPAHALLLIGDPKQSIYGFRGADIYSYLAAKNETVGRHYALDTNFRSTQAVVDAVNYVFEQAEARAGAGAFFFRQAPAAAQPQDAASALAANPLPFIPVKANGLRAFLANAQGQRVPALSLCTQQQAQSSEEGNDWLAQHCAAQIVSWLQTDTLYFQRGQDAAHAADRTPLQPGDIAILVHRRRDAQRMQQALRQRGLSSVYLSDRESVYASAQARDLVVWLQAVAQPTDVALARAALATPLMALTPERLLHMADHEEALDDWLQRLQQWQQVWLKQGVLPMLRQLIHQCGLASQWLAAEDGLGERQLTNVLHIAELLQHASKAHEGEQSLIRFLVQQIHLSEQGAGGMEAEEQTVRLESDAQLIQIVTIHKSKGLEYPVVMLPFGSYMKPVKSGGADWGAGEASGGEADGSDGRDGRSTASSDDERLREDLRLLYVALTRAKHALWVGFAINRRMNSKKGSDLHRSALGYLLCGQAEQAVDDAAWWPLVQAWQANCPDIHARLLPPAPQTQAEIGAELQQKYQPPAMQADWRAAQPYPSGIDQQFAIASFSMLARGASDTKPLAARALQQQAMALAGQAVLTEQAQALSSALAQDAHGEDTPVASGAAFLWQPAARLADDEQTDSVLPTSQGSGTHATLSALAAPPVAAGWHSLAGSSRLGDWMHQALEWLQQEGFPPSPNEALWQRLQRRAQQAGFDAQWPQLQPWLAGILNTDLPLQALVGQGGSAHAPVPLETRRLAEMDQTLAELEFWMPVQQAQAQQLDALCRAYCWPGLARPVLTRRQWHGMVMGFADVVVHSQGRYWVVDYKTNRLGDSAAAYTPEAMRDAVLHHRYDLQAMLYLLALHRLLHNRLPNYQPEQHLGGAMYWFVRGIDHASAGCIHFDTPVAMLLAMDAALRGEAPQPFAATE
ncbi:UvrD-helicase domain-containing protein [Lampropedia aestuarii]|uniref:UvrD-helicase domain-containing protein n=1 Tax=Lampropedia aestuarii TaxID=2562762 RepID=UPI0014560630|nr:UvrD-helicase domain-containing protein [Lampropedia aestuarii]